MVDGETVATTAQARLLGGGAQRGLPAGTWAVAGRALIRAAGLRPDELSAVVVPLDVLTRAAPGDLARALGLVRNGRDTELVDLVVIGGGPAGLAATVYGASEG